MEVPEHSARGVTAYNANPRSENAVGARGAPSVDPAAADDDVAVVEHGGLARRDGQLRRVELDLGAVAVEGPHAAGAAGWRCRICVATGRPAVAARRRWSR